MTLPLRKVLPWLLFAMVLAAALAVGNRAVQNAQHRDYAIEDAECQRAYLEQQVSQLFAETVALRAQISELQKQLADRPDDDN